MSSGPNEFLPVPLTEIPSARFSGDMGYDQPADDRSIDFRRYIHAVLRYKWMILALAVVGLGAGVGLSRLLKPMYEAQASIQIDATSRTPAQPGPIQNVPLMESRGWLELMRSYFVLDEVVRRERLLIETAEAADRPLFENLTLSERFTPGTYSLRVDAVRKRLTLTSDAGAPVEEAAYGDSLGRSLGFLWVPAAMDVSRDVRFIVRVPRDAAVRLNQALELQLPLEAAVIRVQLRGTDASGIAATINAVAERFVEVATLLKRENLTTRTEVLREQLAAAFRDLTAAETALETYRIHTITLPSDRGAAPIATGLAETRDPVRLAFFRLRLDRDSVAQESEAIRRALRAGTDSSASLLIALGTIPSVLNAAELSASLRELTTRRAEARQLRLVFSSTHPPLLKLEREITELESRTVPEQSRAVLAGLDQRVRDLDQRIAASSREMQLIPARATEEARRERDLSLKQTIYAQLQSAFEQARLSELSAAPDVRLLDAAVPPTRPVTDRILSVIAGGLIGGFAVGIFLALVLDRFDRRIRYPEQVSGDLGLSILGALPMVQSKRDGTPDAEQSAQLLEALRTVRMNLGYAHGAAGTLVTTVTSPGAGDGKSFVCANLAKAFSSSGRRTLLIDADTRRGLQHRMMAVSRKPGLLDYLSGTATRDQIIRSIPGWGIDLIPCGTRMAGGPELLSSPQMAQLILGLRSEYQVMIIDSPPLGAGVDPLLLASLSGSLVMVLRNGVTDRELAESRLHELHRLPIRVLGAVLNDVKPEGIYRYYAYIPGYRSADEAVEGAEAEPKRRFLGLR